MAECGKKEAKRTVLIPVDGSENSYQAFEFYVNQVNLVGDRVIILHAFELPPIQYSSGPFVMTFYEEWSQMCKEQRETNEAMLRSYEERLKSLEKPIHHEILMVVGKPAGEVICQVAKDEEVNLVIMGTRGQGLLRRTFMGSVSDYVVHHAHIPVGVVPLPQKVEDS